MTRRVVVTGVGVVAPNGIGVAAFEESLLTSQTGIRALPLLQELNFRSHVAGVPVGYEDRLSQYFSTNDLYGMNQAMTFAAIAAMDAWKDAGLSLPESSHSSVNWDSGCVLGSGLSGIDTIASTLVPLVNESKVKRLGGAIVEQTMSSSLSAKLSGLLALGNQVTTNSSACNTGTEAIHNGFHRIRSGLAKRMLCGGAEAASPYVWAGFDAMRVLSSSFNLAPDKASRPMSASAAGFVPGAGAGVLLLEDLDSARARGADIYAEILAAGVNCGGHRNGGSMTAPNSEAVIRCIRGTIENSGRQSSDIDLINGHLTATTADSLEVWNWQKALELPPENFPLIQSTKSLIGHCLGAAGAIECVAVLLQLRHGFIHGSVNCEDLHELLLPFERSVVHSTLSKEVKICAKASFGFGDVNGCLIFQRWDS